ncbi:hypothetical protein J5226_07235 [Lysobacter sp. K5869]|uniref:hypothetical protein n=1 Tax=Lysobacter sp. K5869 TaxID=2820808 RepID=UPI001C05F217|nr:hypothetical protein [Lysobacter sp. K5869]QWP78182.1 hypothetical protein J5226_07235 [Lysobacter sp. K5869]
MASSVLPALALLVPAGVLLLVRGMRLYRYELGERSFSVKLFGRYELVSIRFEEMLELKVAKWWDVTSAGWSPLLLKDHFALEVVVIKRKDGLYRQVVVTPDNPREFVALIAVRKRALERVEALRDETDRKAAASAEYRK